MGKRWQPARKLSFWSSPSTGGQETLIGSQSKSVIIAHAMTLDAYFILTVIILFSLPILTFVQ